MIVAVVLIGAFEGVVISSFCVVLDLNLCFPNFIDAVSVLGRIVTRIYFAQQPTWMLEIQDFALGYQSQQGKVGMMGGDSFGLVLVIYQDSFLKSEPTAMAI